MPLQIVLDSTVSPATLDLTDSNENWILGAPVRRVNVREVAMKGIVKLDRDTLTFRYVFGKNAERPKQFAADNRPLPAGTATATLTLKRVK